VVAIEVAAEVDGRTTITTLKTQFGRFNFK